MDDNRSLRSNKPKTLSQEVDDFMRLAWIGDARELRDVNQCLQALGLIPRRVGLEMTILRTSPTKQENQWKVLCGAQHLI